MFYGYLFCDFGLGNYFRNDMRVGVRIQDYVLLQVAFIYEIRHR